MKETLSRMKSSISVAASLVLACLLVVSGACRSEEVKSPAATSPQQQKPARIVSLSPSVTEILYGVGAFERVVAVSDYCEYPKEVERLPRVGGWNNPNLEQIASLRPDLVIFSDPQAQFVKDKIEGLGIRTLSVPGRTLEDALKSIELIGNAVGNTAETEKLLAETRATVDDVKRRAEKLPRRRVLCVVDRVPGTLRDLYTASEGSFIEQLIETAGGESVAPPSAGGWGKVQKEAVVALDPEIIIDLMMQPSGGRLAEDTQAVWRELPNLRAVRENRVHALRDPSLIHPSQFVAEAARRFAQIIHPEEFKKE